MSAFASKTYRCEWVAEVYPVDQYDKRQNETPFYEKAFPTREEALADLMEVTSHHPNSPHRRIYRDAPHGYYSTGVRYREVEISSTPASTPKPKSPCGIADPSTRDCQNMKEVGGGMEGERYRCDVCGKSYFLDYDEMK